MGRTLTTTLIVAVSLVVLSGCAYLPQEEPARPPLPNISAATMPPYSVDWSKFPKVEKPMKVWLDADMQQVPGPSHAKYLLLTRKEYAKYVAVLNLAAEYKKLAQSQESLINTYIAVINGHKELVELERVKGEMYKRLYEAANKAYRDERFDHKVDNFVHKLFIGGILTGVLIALF